MTGKDILLSICISSYNRGKLCTELVHNILKIQDDRYNIFICDDCSDDSEFAELLTMQNDKVSLIRNVKNKGACPNWYQTINCGDGQYILHILDRDQIFVDYIIYLLEILENSLIAGGYVGISAMSLTHTVGGNTDYEVLKKGRDAFVAMDVTNGAFGCLWGRDGKGIAHRSLLAAHFAPTRSGRTDTEKRRRCGRRFAGELLSPVGFPCARV